VAGATTTSGIANTGNFANSGNASVGGTLGVNGATTLGSAAGTGGYTATVDSTGVRLMSPGVGGNSVIVNNVGTSLTGGGATMALANGRATFGGVNGGSPITVTGIADGQNQYDAVNWGQVDQIEKNMSRGIAGASAMTNIPQVEANKQFSLGVGVGGFNGETAGAVGGSVRVSQNGILKASVGFAGGGGSNTTWGVGGAWNW
jgi:hypothetical protein